VAHIPGALPWGGGGKKGSSRKTKPPSLGTLDKKRGFCWGLRLRTEEIFLESILSLHAIMGSRGRWTPKEKKKIEKKRFLGQKG